MPRRKAEPVEERPRRRRPPARTPEGRENEVIALAYDLAESQIRNGTASAQVITHFLKLGSTKERLEQEILRKQGKLMDAKTDSIESSKQIGELYKNALDAMRLYGGAGGDVDEDL